MLEKALKNTQANELFEAISNLKTPDECQKFLRDLCTLSELQSMVERFQVAKKVVEGKSYRKINEETGASTATVTRVAHWVHHGMGGYKLALDHS